MIKGLVSIIIPVYNMEKLLPKCIESILKQTYSNIELIIVDDGSTDRSGIICDEYARNDKRVKVIHQANGGIACAFNSGMDAIRGDSFLFVDSDDYIDHCMVKRLKELMDEYGADIVQCGTYTFKEEQGIGYITQKEGEVICYNSRSEILDDFFHYRRISRNLAARLFKTILIDSIRCEPGRMIIDAVTLPQILVRCNKYVFIREKYYYIYVRSTSVSRRPYSISQWEDCIYGNSFMESFICENCPEYIDFAYYRYVYTNKKAYLGMYRNWKGERRIEIMQESLTLYKKYYPIFKKTRWYKGLNYGLRASFAVFFRIPQLYRLYWISKENTLTKLGRIKQIIKK